VVELQRFCFGQGDSSGVPHPELRRAVAVTVSGMRKSHGQDGTDCGYPLIRYAHFAPSEPRH
jgi:hypothetical protein